MEIALLSDIELMALCKEYGHKSLEFRRKFAMLLPEVEKRGLYKREFCSIYDFAAKLGGMARRHVNAVLGVFKKLEGRPVLTGMIEEQGWSKMKVAANLVSDFNEIEIAEVVRILPKAALETYARELQGAQKTNELKALNKPKWESALRPAEGKILRLDLGLTTDFERGKLSLEREMKRKLSDLHALRLMLKKLARKVKPRKSNGVKVGSRVISAQQKRELLEQFDYRCAFPGCNKIARELHHVDRFAISGDHMNVKPLCFDHHKIAHAGLIGNEHLEPERWFLRRSPEMNRVDEMYQEYKKKSKS